MTRNGLKNKYLQNENLAVFSAVDIILNFRNVPKKSRCHSRLIKIDHIPTDKVCTTWDLGRSPQHINK